MRGYIVRGTAPVAATGAEGIPYAALVTKALSAPRAKAATPAMVIARSIAGCCAVRLELDDEDIFLIFSRTYGSGRL